MRDVYCEGGTIKAVGEGLEAPCDARGRRCRRRAGDARAGSTRTPTWKCPSWARSPTDDFFTGPAAALAGGTTMIIDFVIPDPAQRPMEAGATGCSAPPRRRRDYSFHVAITNWNEKIERGHGRARPRERGQQLQALHGLQGRGHARRREDARELRPLSGARRALHRPRRERRAGLAPAAVASRQGHYRAGGAPAVAPAGGRGRGGQPGDPHRPGAERPHLHRPRPRARRRWRP